MKINLDKEEAIQLMVLGLQTPDSPIQIARGFVPVDGHITAQGNVSFELAQEDDRETD